MRTITESESTPKADGFFMPAEFAPQDRVWMGWPHRTDTWAHGAKPAQRQYAAIARAIAEFTPVFMCANQADYANCKAVFEDDENVTVIEMTTDDAWFRDTAATYVIDGKGGKRANHWHFNAYGGLVDGLYFPCVSVNLFFTSFAKQARRSRKGGFTGCANVFSPIPVTA